MIRDWQEWSVDLSEHSNLEDLKDCTVAIEAAEYLKTRILDDPQWREPLLPAVGGLPFAMRRLCTEDLHRFKEHGITPFFVFPGLEIGPENKDQTFRAAEEAARINDDAWSLYDRHEAEKAVATFGRSGSVKATEFLRYFQSILRADNIRFQVAPYSACAQLAYLSNRAGDVIHAIAGSSEILLYDVDKVITSFDFEAGHFSLVRRHRCIQDLGNGNITPDMFVDACLLSGTSISPTLPQLEGATHRKQLKIRGAIDMMLSSGRSGISVCMNYQDDPQFQKLKYLDTFRKSRLAIKHHVVLTKEGKIEPLDAEHAPGDIHEFIGHRLPDELYFYLSKGVISPKVLTWRSSGEILELPPVDNGSSNVYRRLVKDQLAPIRSSALALLTYSLHRVYQHKDLTARYWFEKDREEKINVREEPDKRNSIGSWQVNSSLIDGQRSKFSTVGTIGFAVRSLTDAKFASSTIASKDKKLLNTKEEILNNAFWRFLHLRYYVDDKHQLTKWGHVLSTILQKLEGKPDLEEAAVVAVELARLNLLNGEKMFDYGGGPGRGTGEQDSDENEQTRFGDPDAAADKDKEFVLLVSRVACLGRLRHKSLGFTGPLSRHLLGYHSITTAVRSSLRDLAEVSLTALLLSGDAERDRDDFTDIGLELPFLLPNDCALGVAVKSYLDEIVVQQDPTSSEAKANVKMTAKQFWFPQCEDFVEDLKTAFALWDAVYAGIKSSGDLTSETEKATWTEVNQWLEDRR